jgi:23S rRNA (uracil1939-C5)-methyltransferase
MVGLNWILEFGDLKHMAQQRRRNNQKTGGKPLPENVVLVAGPPAYGGYTIGRIPAEVERSDEEQPGGEPRSKVALIRGAIPGELVEVSAIEEKKDYYIAQVDRIIEPSPYRVRPKYGYCTGCQLEYIAYDKQVEIKQDVLADALRRIGGLNIVLDEPLALKESAWHYRYRAQFKLQDGKIGFFKERTNEVTDMEYSPLLIEPINIGLKRTHDALHKQPKLFEGVTEIHIAYGDGLFATIKTNPAADVPNRHWDELAHAMINYDFRGILIETGTRNQRKSLAFGEEFLVLKLDPITYTVSPNSFFQSNWLLNQKLVALIREKLRPLHVRRVLDLYSGAGNFALPVALDAGYVVAVEENPVAVKDGLRNLSINKIENVEFVRSSAEDFDIEGLIPLDVVLLDPPRAGVSPTLIDGLIEASPQRIVYVSCNPSTFARDLKKLIANYEVESVRLVDFFPQTYHIEAVGFLNRRW